ncbi:MAG: TadE/TadG family type IV pilus assembly protein [Caulobacteraceae bacterium]
MSLRTSPDLHRGGGRGDPDTILMMKPCVRPGPQALKPARGVLARFSANRRGATAVEFALVIIPLLFILFSILEISLIFLVALTLEGATAKAARSLRVASASSATGVSNTASVNAFRQLICSNMGWLSSQCVYTGNSGLVIDVRDPASFAAGTTTSSAINGGVLSQYDGSKCFYSGQAGGDIVVVRAFYPWTLFIPYLNLAFPKLSNGQIVLSDTEVFKLEPNSNTDSTTTSC